MPYLALGERVRLSDTGRIGNPSRRIGQGQQGIIVAERTGRTVQIVVIEWDDGSRSTCRACQLVRVAPQ